MSRKFGGVEKVDARIDGGVDDRETVRFVHVQSKFMVPRPIGLTITRAAQVRVPHLMAYGSERTDNPLGMT